MQEQFRMWGHNIKRGREALGMSQPAFAEAFDPPVSQQTVSKWERGKIIPRDEMKVRIATILHQDVRQLFPLTRNVA